MDPLKAGDPSQVGGYRLLARLGGGGMGQVFLGETPGHRKVAVKLIRPEYADEPDFRLRFTREVAAAREVGGVHTALVIDADPDGDPPWMATAYFPGPSLAAKVNEQGPLDTVGVSDLGGALAEGLSAIHACGIIHRDLKPSNIIMAEDGPRIIDFGVVKRASATTITPADAPIGTVQYMSPEHLGVGDVISASDVFSVGSVLTFAATGHGPFDAPENPAVIGRILTQPPALGSLIPPLRDIICACLAKNPAGRPSLSELLAYFSGTGSSVVPSSVAVHEVTIRESTTPGPRWNQPDTMSLASGGALMGGQVAAPLPVAPSAVAPPAGSASDTPPAGTVLLAGEVPPGPGSADGGPEQYDGAAGLVYGAPGGAFADPFGPVLADEPVADEPVVPPPAVSDGVEERRGIARGGSADDDLPRVRVRDLPPDVRSRFWRLRITILVIVCVVFAVITRSWVIALTLAILAGTVDWVRRSRSVALYANGGFHPGARRATSRQLARMLREGYFALDARCIPNSREIIDHLVIGPTGVYAIDSEKWNPRLPVRTLNGKWLYLGPESQKDRLEHAVWEAEQASEILSGALGTEIAVQPVLAIYGAIIPWDIATISNVDVFTGPALRKYLKRRGRLNKGVVRLTGEEIRSIYDTAARMLPARQSQEDGSRAAIGY